MSYQYKGKFHDIDPRLDSAGPELVTYPNCGTEAGYRRHLKEGTLSCQPCRDRHASYTRAYRERLKTVPARVPGFDPSKCGTYAGYARHQRAADPACDACLTAYADYMAGYRAARKAAA